MKETKYTFNFKGGPIVVWALNEREGRILAKAEAIKRGWDNTVIDEIANPVDRITIDKFIMYIVEMEDSDTLDEQMDCIDALKRLRNKLKLKEDTHK